jgi:YD repeat-containing protein
VISYRPPGEVRHESRVRLRIVPYDGNGNGNRLTTTDPLSHATTSSYDALKRLLTMTDPGLGVTSYAHDNAGNLTGVTDSRDLTTTYGHDGLGNPRKWGQTRLSVPSTE